MFDIYIYIYILYEYITIYGLYYIRYIMCYSYSN